MPIVAHSTPLRSSESQGVGESIRVEGSEGRSTVSTDEERSREPVQLIDQSSAQECRREVAAALDEYLGEALTRQAAQCTAQVDVASPGR